MISKEEVFSLVSRELDRALELHPEWKGNRHGQSVIEEEYIEFRDEVFADHPEAALREVVQLAAMAVRFAMHEYPEWCIPPDGR